LVQMAGETTQAHLTLPFEAEAMEVVDFRGRPLSSEVTWENNRVDLPMDGWQIATLRIQPRGL
jgi:hypothetical protein